MIPPGPLPRRPRACPRPFASDRRGWDAACVVRSKHGMCSTAKTAKIPKYMRENYSNLMIYSDLTATSLRPHCDLTGMMARQPYFRLVKYYRDVRGWIPAESRFDYEAQPGVYQCFTNRTRGTDLDEAWPMADNLCGFVQWVYHGIPIWTHSHSNGKWWYGILWIFYGILSAQRCQLCKLLSSVVLSTANTTLLPSLWRAQCNEGVKEIDTRGIYWMI